MKDLYLTLKQFVVVNKYRLAALVVAIIMLTAWWLGSNRSNEVVDIAEGIEKVVQEQSTESAAPKSDDKAIVWDNGAGVNNNFEANSPEAKAASVVNEVGVALQAKDGPKLHALLSSEMQDLFTEESVISAMNMVEGLTIKPISPIEIEGEWAKQKVVGIDSAGKSEEYTVVLKLEDGQWRLYGTTKE